MNKSAISAKNSSKSSQNNSEIAVIGEAILDLKIIPNKQADDFSIKMVCGGSPFNIACNLGKQNIEAAYIGGISKQLCAQAFIKNIKKYKLNTKFCDFSSDLPALAMISLNKKKIPNYSFFLKNSAFENFNAKNINIENANFKLIHFGSMAIFYPQYYKIYKKLLAQNKALSSIDINFRPALAPSLSRALSIITKLIKKADIIKASDEDLSYIFPSLNFKQAKDKLLSLIKRDSLLILTRGKLGASAYIGKNRSEIKIKAKNIKVRDTVGAGDAFMAGFLAYLLKLNRPVEKMSSVLSDKVVISKALANGVDKGTKVCLLDRAII